MQFAGRARLHRSYVAQQRATQDDKAYDATSNHFSI
jgi:hypothetical protein